MRLAWVDKLQHALQVMAFCLAIATIQVAFEPDRPYGPPVAYSLAHGLVIWAIIDIGRHFVPGSEETGWPPGWRGALLVAFGIVAGWFVGGRIGNGLCEAFGLYVPGFYVDPVKDIRNSVLITIMAGVAGSYWFYSRNRSAYLEGQMVEASRRAGEARLKLLEAQLEPHMLFNTLANLRVLIGVDPDRAQQMLDHMIAYLRATLGASRAATHPLQAEFDRLRDYLALMQIRMGPRLAYSLDLPPELAQLPVPTLLLQPLVENSIKHGLEPKVEGGRVDVAARREGDSLVIDVVDTGVGMTEPQPGRPAGSGFGQAQVRERLATLYGDRAAMEFIAGRAGGTRSSVRFPLEKKA